jgi:hypothetical protein
MENEVEIKEEFVLSEESVRELVLGWRRNRDDTEFLTEKYNPAYSWGKPEEHFGYTFGNEETHGGSEGDGEEYWVVFSAKKDGVKTYYKIPGYYASYDGGNLDWGYLFEVEPYEKTGLDWRAPTKKD